MPRAGLAALLAGAALPCAPLAAQTLDEVVAASLAHSPALAASTAREDSAAASVDEARAQRMPSAQAQAQLGAGWIDPQGFFGLSADSVVPRVAQVTAELPLYAGGRIGAARQAAEAGRSAAAFGTQATALDVRIQVVRAYSQALAAEQQARSYAKLGEALDEALRQARLKFQVGEGTSTEVAQAEARRAEAQAGLAAAHGSLATAHARLAVLAGQPISPDEPMPAPPPVPDTAAEAVALALAGNPSLAQARAAAEAAGAGIKAARAEGLPTVGLYAEGASVRDQFFPGYKADSASAGVRASWKFFSGGRVSAKVRKAAADARAAEADAQAAAQGIEGQAQQGFAAVASARAVLAAADSRSVATQEALRGTRLEVSVGEKPQLALLDAEREAIEADTARIGAQAQLLVATYTLLAITGGEFD